MKILGILSVLIVAAGAALNCNGGALNPAQRAEVVAQHNRLRSSVATGASSPGPRGGKNIYALSYDCTLESQAQAQANRCVAQRSPLSSRFDAGENFFIYRGNAGAPGAIAFASMQWWNQIFRGWNTDANNTYTAAVHATGIDMYAQMAWGASTRIGCGVARCNAFRSVVCQYRTGGPQINQVMVQAGTGCTAADQCTTFPNSTCDTALQLCRAPENADPIPPTTGPSTTTGPTTTTTLSPLELCDASQLLTPELRQTILDTHNEMRSSIVKTRQVAGTFTSGCQDMFALQYDCGLEAAALLVADACAEPPPVSPSQGVNIYKQNPVNPLPAVGVSVLAALKQWKDEVANFKARKPLKADNVEGNENKLKDVGRFAQMAYSKTTKVGCGYGICADGSARVVCNYEAQRGAADTPVFDPVSSTKCILAKCRTAAVADVVISAAATCNQASGLCEVP